MRWRMDGRNPKGHTTGHTAVSSLGSIGACTLLPGTASSNARTSTRTGLLLSLLHIRETRVAGKSFIVQLKSVSAVNSTTQDHISGW